MEDDYGFLDDARQGQSRRSGGEGAAPVQRRRRRARTGKRSDRANFTQISAWVRREVKADFDFARAREIRERGPGQGREQAQIIESLMRFYAEEGDPWEVLGERS